MIWFIFIKIIFIFVKICIFSNWNFNWIIYHTPKEIRIPRGVTSLPSSSSYPNFNLDYNSHYCKNDGSSYKTYGVTDGGINLYIPKEVNSISSDSIQFSNFKKIYVESKGTKTKLLEAINDYCDERYSYFDYCYYSSDKCVRELNKRVVLDPLSF